MWDYTIPLKEPIFPLKDADTVHTDKVETDTVQTDKVERHTIQTDKAWTVSPSNIAKYSQIYVFIP